ncbi:Pilin (type 1 fimbria component protein) [Dyella sp. OK004]|uniref:fimbrial protein n=1 Tax=Dyella sp. OK004 TaxID=1855292 RepID=UPI0008E15781|nr:fimbrial protein [Dyella sp. OK004]SFR95157.1 Pilin (type 1 fimbria component protein) [Dyella sp. OK004]
MINGCRGKMWLNFLLFMGLFYFWHDSFAANCTSVTSIYNRTETLTANVPSNLANGQVIVRGSDTIPRTQYGACSSGQSGIAGIGFGRLGWQLVPGYTNVYTASGMASGLGVRILVDNAPVALDSLSGVGGFLAKTWRIGPGGGKLFFQGSIAIELVKTGDISFINSGPYCITSIVVGQNGNGISYCPYVNARVTPATCNVTTTNVVIPLGNVQASIFTAVGSTSSLSQNYNINLNCQNSPNVSMSINGVAVSGNNNVFGLTADANAAKGIAVQLVRNNANAVRGQTYPISNAAPDGTLSIPIAARYYRIGDVSSGAANARMTATFTYK